MGRRSHKKDGLKNFGDLDDGREVISQSGVLIQKLGMGFIFQEHGKRFGSLSRKHWIFKQFPKVIPNYTEFVLSRIQQLEKGSSPRSVKTLGVNERKEVCTLLP